MVVFLIKYFETDIYINICNQSKHFKLYLFKSDNRNQLIQECVEANLCAIGDICNYTNTLTTDDEWTVETF